MRLMRGVGQTIIALLVIGLAVGGSRPTSAAGGSSWQTPVLVKDSTRQFIDYHVLPATGDAIYYQLTVKTPTSIIFEVSISRLASVTFAPQLVIFEPNDQTIGPILPITQPPQTIATVYPMTPAQPIFDALTQTFSTIRLQARPEFRSPGTYIFAVYNAGRSGGQYRFIMNRNVGMSIGRDILTLPKSWWQDQTFAGFSWTTLMTPLLLGLAMWLVYLRLDHHQLHVHKTYAKRAAKKIKK